MKQIIQKASFISFLIALVLLTIGIVTSNALFISIACSCSLLGWLLKKL